MLSDFLYSSIKSQLPFDPTEEQDELIRQLASFVLSGDERRCFVLRGYAGTGKTSVLAALVRGLNKVGKTDKVVLLAPTGRAAKVLSRYSGYEASTIHRAIYRQSKVKDTEAYFSLGYNKAKDTLFIVDEASMVSNLSDGTGGFGTGNVLEDLINYVYQGEHCTLLFVGDDAQLPPVGQATSPALDSNYLMGYGLAVQQYTLRKVIRQALTSGILTEATRLRFALTESLSQPFSYKQIAPHPDVTVLKPTEVQDRLEHSYHEVGIDETLVVTRSNKRTNLYNRAIRARILWKEEQLTPSERIMVSRNNYFYETFLANGETLELLAIRNERELYGYHFTDARVRFGNKREEMTVILWLDTLMTDTPEDSYAMQRDLYYKIAADYPEIRSRKKLRDKVFESPYYNALQIRYAYAVTCHKAQGGQWSHVYIDPGALHDKNPLNQDDLRWLYTAITRATEKIYLLGAEP